MSRVKLLSQVQHKTSINLQGPALQIWAKNNGPSQLEVQWAYSGHLVHLQWGTVHALYASTVGTVATL